GNGLATGFKVSGIGDESVAYALYVLARNARAPIGDLRYYADTRLTNFKTPLAQAQLGAALAMYGDRTRAAGIFRTALTSFEKPADDRWRADYGTALRDTAGILALVSEARVSLPAAASLEDVVAKALSEKSHTSTQENAWVLLAAQSLKDEAEDHQLMIGGTALAGQSIRSLKSADILEGTQTVRNTGNRPVTTVVTVTGDALTPEPQDARGLGLTREYFSLDGKPLSLASSSGGESSLRQNQRMVVVLHLEEAIARGGRFMIVDHLPAGLEIENPRLVTGGQTAALRWLKTAKRPVHTDFRKDRVVAAYNLPVRNNTVKPTRMSLAYIVRSVSPGSFRHPAATAEDMYRPDRYARTGSGRLTVTEVR
ncbi:MAG: alpha-2-macroglobulin family protein, partial [Pseudomonadota bacterium]